MVPRPPSLLGFGIIKKVQNGVVGENGAHTVEEETRALVEGALPPWARSPVSPMALTSRGCILSSL